MAGCTTVTFAYVLVVCMIVVVVVDVCTTTVSTMVHMPQASSSWQPLALTSNSWKTPVAMMRDNLLRLALSDSLLLLLLLLLAVAAAAPVVDVERWLLLLPVPLLLMRTE